MVGPKSWDELISSKCPAADANLNDAAVLQPRKKNTGRKCVEWKVDMNSPGWPLPEWQPAEKPLVAVCHGVIWFYMIGVPPDR